MAVMSDPFGGFDPSMFSNVPLFKELAKVMSWTGGPVNWNLAADTAASLTGEPKAIPAASGSDTDFPEAVRVAELWLDQVTVLPAVEGPAVALSAAEWTRQAASSSGLGVYIEPVARGMTGSLAEGLPEQLAAMGGPVTQAMESMSAMLYGVQAGTVAGHLAGQLLGLYDLGVPTLDPRTVGTVGDNATQFAASYDFDPVEFRYWLALREASHRRMFAGVEWLRPRVAALIGQFAEGAQFNLEEMLEGMGGMGLDPTDPEALREALSGPDAFRIEPTSEQRAALRDLQALVSFVEGWSDTMVRAAAGDKLQALPRIEEATRRRRAEKGPGERSLEQLLGLDLKPADARLGPAFCDAVITARGLEGLDRAWSAQQWLPTADELDDPSRWLVRLAAAEIEAEIEADLGPMDDPEA
jgi:putative hydrolase